jgi:LAS superfamily LD-carboxypeptidase LdcB
VPLTAKQVLGKDDSHLQWQGNVGLHPACWQSFERLRAAAAESGIDLQVASGFRSFERQLAIWNDKAAGRRPVHDDAGNNIDMAALSEEQRVHAILRYSALPGASRHHWGTDIDVYDAAAVPPGYTLQLTPAEYADDGLFGPLHHWLSEHVGQGMDFYRPYALDRGGVAPERWHISCAPLASECGRILTTGLLREALSTCELALSSFVLAQLPDLYRRYIADPCA